jgi:3-oxoadipate enol-lactonase
MRREKVGVGHKTINYLIAEPATPAVRQRPLSTVVFLHAFPLDAAMWEPNLAAIPDGWRAVAPELRGEAGVTMSDLAGDVIDLLDHLRVSRAAVVGCSMGGYVLFEILKSAPGYLSAVGLVSTRPGPDSEEGRKNRHKMIALLEAEGVEAIAAQMVPKLLGVTTQGARPGLAEELRSLILGNPAERVRAFIVAMMERADSTPLLANVEVPALVMHGAEDALIPPAEAEGMHRSIKHSRLELISSSGHLPNLEQTEPFDAILWNFLAQL